MDDIAVRCNDEVEVEQPKGSLAKEFETNDLGSLKQCIGIEVAKSIQGIIVCQRKYVIDLLKDSGMMGVSHVPYPLS